MGSLLESHEQKQVEKAKVAKLAVDSINDGEPNQEAIDEALGFILDNISNIEDPIEKLVWIKQAKMGEFESLINAVDASKLVPDSVTAGVSVLRTNREKADKLFQNFIANFRFRYTGSATPKVCLATGNGDCATLANAFVMLLQAFGIDDAEKAGIEKFNLVDSCVSFGRDGTYSTEARGEHYWAFANHYWAEAAGREYDLLFNTTGPKGGARPASFHLKTGGDTYEGVEYYIYANNACLIPARPGNKEKLDEDITTQGLALVDEATTKRYIDDHLKR